MFYILFFAVMFLPGLVLAQEELNVVINEIAWMGTPIAGIEENQWWRYEWLELYNTKESPLQLDGWEIELWRDKLDFTVSLKGTIVPSGYYLAGASEKIPNLDLNYNNLGGKFNNSGQRVVLKNNLGEVVDEVDTTSGWFAGDNKTKQTMERVGQGWQTSVDSGGTPKSPNSTGMIQEPVAQLNLVKDKVNSDLAEPSYSHLGSAKDEKDGTEKDLSQSFQSRVPVINPITLLAGLLALGFSGVLLALKRFLALRQRSGQAFRQERRQLEHPERSRRT